jgi:hypothetical protein
MDMKNKYRRRRHTIEAKGNSTVFVDGHGREYYLVERQKPDQQKRLFSTDKDKRTVKGFWIDILLMWLVRLIANLIPVNIWSEG